MERTSARSEPGPRMERTSARSERGQPATPALWFRLAQSLAGQRSPPAAALGWQRAQRKAPMPHPIVHGRRARFATSTTLANTDPNLQIPGQIRPTAMRSRPQSRRESRPPRPPIAIHDSAVPGLSSVHSTCLHEITARVCPHMLKNRPKMLKCAHC